LPTPLNPKFYSFRARIHNPKAVIARERSKNCELKTIESGLALGESASKYTVPAIHHVPTNTYIMDSVPISQFIEATYPEKPVHLTSELGKQIEAQARPAIGPVIRISVTPRELNILSPRAQEYFRRTREAALGHPLEDLLDPQKEEEAWNAVGDGMRALGELMRTNKAEGPFVLGAQPSITDFFVAGLLQMIKTVDEGIFEKMVPYPGFKDIYEACQPYMEKRD